MQPMNDITLLGSTVCGLLIFAIIRDYHGRVRVCFCTFFSYNFLDDCWSSIILIANTPTHTIDCIIMLPCESSATRKRKR